MPIRDRASTPSAAGQAAARPAPPTFLFGIGAAKAGSTWLYEYLRAHPDCHVRGYKELHYFDAIEQGLVPNAIAKVSDQIARHEAQLPSLPEEERQKRLAELFDMRDFRHVLQTWHRDRNAYLRYMMTGVGNRRLVADITPGYALLSPAMLRTMAGCAPRTRFLYLLRDPVERLWSHVRMNARRSLPQGADFEDHAHRELSRVLAEGDPWTLGQSDYARTLAALEEGVPPERRLVMFYEDLITPGGLKRLCAFLGIRAVPADFGRVVLRGREAPLAPAQRAALSRLLAPQYAAVAARFPRLPAAWRAGAEGVAA